ncbi:MAG: CRISPR-associated helicase Cas3', partial [Nitrospinae bacterium]|nr:CRISPR-associated helicase Cas3' [Nitrospinota bacterium]
RGLKQEIQDCLNGFIQRFPESQRNAQQAEVARQLSEADDEESSVKVLNGPAGCGKTKIALEWAANTNARKILWICPRVQVCQGLIKDLTSSDYLFNTSIEINTGEFKTIYQSGKERDTPEGKEFSGDIVVTTIDQISNSIITHKKVTTLVTYMNAHVVFDEYHEYINMPAFNLLFAEFIECKKLQKNKAKALLVSATPNYFFVEEFLGIEGQEIKGIESFNQSTYRIQFTTIDEGNKDEGNPLYKLQPENTFVISNTALTAQKSFIQNQSAENAILFHGRYKKSDKQDIFDRVFESFQRDGRKQYDVLRAGPIVQASLNITCDRMITEFTSAENWLQRLGRLDRFGTNKEVNDYITVIPQTLAIGGKQVSRCAKFLHSLHSLQSAKAWHEFLNDRILENPVHNLSEIYQMYQEFYDSDKGRNAVEQDLKDALKQSANVLTVNLLEPISFPARKKPKDGKVKISKNSLRGSNLFVQMAIANVQEKGEITFPNNYAYEESDLDANLTESEERILGYGNSEQDLRAFMFKKHHSIKRVKKVHKDFMLSNEARSPETPIYLSYTPEDLKKVEGEPHPFAMYYAIGSKQAIGSISINNLITQKGGTL